MKDITVHIPENSPLQSSILGDGKVIRVLGSTVAYVQMGSNQSFAFSPEDIIGYKGEQLTDLGVMPGARVTVKVDNNLSDEIKVSINHR